MAAQDNITAHVGGGQGNATAITGNPARVTSAGPQDSVVLPFATAGTQQTVVNATPVTIQVFPALGDTLGANAPAVILGNKTALFTCVGAGQWHSLSA